MLDRLRRALARIGTLGTATLGIALWELGARVGVPGLDPTALTEYMRTHGNFMLRLYDMLSGGALARGALLGLGILPYFSARIWMRLARIVSPRLREMWATRVGRDQLRDWTRRLTIVLAAIQAIGFSRFAIKAEAAVPPLFNITTMLLLTAGAVFAMLVTEQISRPADADLPIEDVEPEPEPATVPELTAGSFEPVAQRSKTESRQPQTSGSKRDRHRDPQ